MGIMAWINERRQAKMAEAAEKKRVEAERVEAEAKAAEETARKAAADAARQAAWNAARDKAEPLFERAAVALKEKRFSDAIELIDECFKDNIYADGRIIFRDEARWIRALSYYGMERYNEAIDVFREVRNSNGDHSLDCLMPAGISYTRIGKYREAEEIFRTLLREMPPFAPAPPEVKWHLLLCKHNGDETAAKKERFSQ